MKLVGLDQSLAKAGWSDGETTKVLKPPAKLMGVARLQWWYDETCDWAGPDVVVLMEDYGYSRAEQAHQIGEAGGVVKLALMHCGATRVPISTTCVKRFATGKGNASKPAVVSHVSQRSGLVFGSDDECDAYALVQMALAQLKPESEYLTMKPTNKNHRDALAAVNWPVIL